MKYRCSIKRGQERETWLGGLRLLFKYPGLYEVEIRSSEMYFNIIIAQHCCGNYLYIRNHGVGSELFDLKNLLWNTENLSEIMKESDAVTVATGLCYLDRIGCAE